MLNYFTKRNVRRNRTKTIYFFESTQYSEVIRKESTAEVVQNRIENK